MGEGNVVWYQTGYLHKYRMRVLAVYLFDKHSIFTTALHAVRLITFQSTKITEDSVIIVVMVIIVTFCVVVWLVISSYGG